MYTSGSCESRFAKIIVTIAVLMGLLAIFIPPQYIDYLIQFSKFFEAMIPVLAVGALLKYLCCSMSKNCSTDGNYSNKK